MRKSELRGADGVDEVDVEEGVAGIRHGVGRGMGAGGCQKSDQG